jgi:enoyl-CoA hydratase/carnithine racemase
MPPSLGGPAVPDSVLVADDGPVRVVTLNRPLLRNAIDLELREVLAEALEAAMTDTGVRAVVLTGAGGTFCAGGDITTMRAMPPEEARPRVAAVQRVVRAIWHGPKPVVAAVEGHAVGAGAALAIACDLVVAAVDVTVSTAFTRVGLAGDMGIFASLPDRVGRAAARGLLLAPRAFTGTEAHAAGLVDELTPPSAALAGAMAAASALADGPPLAFAEIKAMLVAGRDEVLAREVEAAVRLMGTEDFAEGVAAFQERRSPRFLGA